MHGSRGVALVGTILTTAAIGVLQVYLAVHPGITPAIRLDILMASAVLALLAILCAIALAVCDYKIAQRSEGKMDEFARLIGNSNTESAAYRAILSKNLAVPGTLIYRALRLVSDLDAIVEPFLDKQAQFRGQIHTLNQLREHPGAEELYAAQHGFSRETAVEAIRTLEREAMEAFREGKYQDALQAIVHDFAAEGFENDHLSAFVGLGVDEPWTIRNFRDDLNRLIADYAARH